MRPRTFSTLLLLLLWGASALAEETAPRGQPTPLETYADDYVHNHEQVGSAIGSLVGGA